LVIGILTKKKALTIFENITHPLFDLLASSIQTPNVTKLKIQARQIKIFFSYVHNLIKLKNVVFEDLLAEDVYIAFL